MIIKLIQKIRGERMQLGGCHNQSHEKKYELHELPSLRHWKKFIIFSVSGNLLNSSASYGSEALKTDIICLISLFEQFSSLQLLLSNLFLFTE